MALLRQEISGRYLNQLWQLSSDPQFLRSRPCPHCAKPMAEVWIPPPADLIKLDVCRVDHFIWLDSGEFQRLPAPEPGEQVSEPAFPLAEEAFIQAKAEAMAERKIREQRLRSAVVGDWWEFLWFFYRLVRGDF